MTTANHLIKKVHKEKSLVLLSALVLILLLGTGSLLLYTILTGKIPCILGSGIIAIIFVTLVLSYGYAPLSIELSDRSLILHRGIGKKVIHYADMKHIDTYISKEAMIRTCGIGGLFGFTGWYYTKKLGNFFSYVGDYSQTFCIELINRKKYLLSGEDRDYLVAFLKEKISGEKA